MEYGLLKTLDQSPSSSSFINITPFPSTDCITPGFGQVVNQFSLYIPIHQKPSLHTVVKSIESESIELEKVQDGGGSIQAASNDSSNTDEILNKLNEKKRKLLDDSIYSSFLHPKLIKTETIPIQSAKKVQKGKGVKQSNEIQPTKTLSHKFQFAD